MRRRTTSCWWGIRGKKMRRIIWVLVGIVSLAFSSAFAAVTPLSSGPAIVENRVSLETTNDGAVVHISLPEKSENTDISIKKGNSLIRTLHKGHLPAGIHRFRWDGKDDGGKSLPPGLYAAEVRGDILYSESFTLGKSGK